MNINKATKYTKLEQSLNGNKEPNTIHEDLNFLKIDYTRNCLLKIKINMKNPISGMSISEDRGRTWWAMSPWGATDMFLRPPVLTKENNLLVRVESWMGGSSVFVSSGPDLIWSPGSLGGNNVCRGIFKFRVSE